MRFATLTIGLMLLALNASAVELGTWNVKHLGDAARDWQRTADVIAPYDFVALQEVHGDRGVQRIEALLEQSTGIEWESLTSGRAVGRGQYKENYAFIWRAGSVRYDGGANTYIDSRDVFAREPFAARFSSADGYQWVAANVHVIWGSEDRSRSAQEVAALDSYLAFLEEEIAEGRPVILMGDFNLEPSDPAWNGIRQSYRLALGRGATTLSPVDGRFASLYDNVIYRGVRPSRAVVDAFPQRLNVSHKYARANISDHAPVRFTLGDGSAGNMREATGNNVRGTRRATGAQSGVDRAVAAMDDPDVATSIRQTLLNMGSRADEFLRCLNVEAAKGTPLLEARDTCGG